jgi:hypothetical protein
MGTPGSGKQGTRLTPQFRALAQALDEQRATLVQEGVDADPELIAVFDLVGGVDEFYRAVAHIPGLEFLADLEDDDVDADEDFFLEKNGQRTESPLPHSLYLVATNAEAIQQLLNLWDQWVADPSAELPRGLARVRQLFAQLRAIRRWGPEDRLRDSGLIDDWQARADFAHQQYVRVEVELWFRSDARRRQNAEEAVAAAIREAGGDVLHTSVLPGIRYHGMLGSIPRGAIDQMLDGAPEDLALLITEEVMFVRPASRVQLGVIEAVEEERELSINSTAPTTEPRVALFDGLPLAAHETLQDRIVIVDPDGIEETYPAPSRVHGTAMASLILHGDLSSPGIALASRLYTRPVLVPRTDPGGPAEEAPSDRLFVDVLHRAFVDLFTGPASVRAPSVKVVSLSICDEARHFVREMSPLARLIDWAAHEFNVLVVVSAGNHPENVSLELPPSDLLLADPTDLQVAAIAVVHSQSLHRRLLSPAESINALTIGSHAADASGDVVDQRIDLFPTSTVPAPYSARGAGFGRSVKPDAMYPGGRVFYDPPLPDPQARSDLYASVSPVLAPGVLAAAPGTLGSTTSTAFGVGTSQAAALAARSAGLACEVLERLHAADPSNPCLAEESWPVLLKALAAHPARWGDARSVYSAAASLERRDLTHALGYGAVNSDEVTNSVASRALLIGAGQISHKDKDIFQLPLPPGIRARADWRRLVVTLAWISPIAPQARRRRAARLWFEPPTDGLGVVRSEADHNAVRRGTLQHEVLEGSAALAFVDGDFVTIEVNCRMDHVPESTAVRYGIVVSLEVGATIGVDVHQELSVQLQARAAARVRIGGNT